MQPVYAGCVLLCGFLLLPFNHRPKREYLFVFWYRVLNRMLIVESSFPDFHGSQIVESFLIPFVIIVMYVFLKIDYRSTQSLRCPRNPLQVHYLYNSRLLTWIVPFRAQAVYPEKSCLCTGNLDPNGTTDAHPDIFQLLYRRCQIQADCHSENLVHKKRLNGHKDLKWR